jgi:tRNA-intron endonuclease
MEEAQPIRGELTEEGVVVADPKAVAELAQRGYGVKEAGRLRLQDHEALYLLHIKRLTLTREGREVTPEELVSWALKRDPEAWTRFMVYRDLRSRGYVVREGFGFGVDFRVYERGQYGVKPATRVVFALREGGELSLKKLAEYVDQITRMGKVATLAVLERRGEIVYYQVSKARLKEEGRAAL